MSHSDMNMLNDQNVFGNVLITCTVLRAHAATARIRWLIIAFPPVRRRKAHKGNKLLRHAPVQASS